MGKAKEARDTYNELKKIVDIAKKVKDLAEDPRIYTDAGSKSWEGRDCRVFGTGWIHYAPTDPTNGDRPTGAAACLDKAYIDEERGTETKQVMRRRPPTPGQPATPGSWATARPGIGETPAT